MRFFRSQVYNNINYCPMLLFLLTAHTMLVIFFAIFFKLSKAAVELKYDNIFISKLTDANTGKLENVT